MSNGNDDDVKSSSLIYLNNAGMARYDDATKAVGCDVIMNQSVTHNDPKHSIAVRDLYAQLIDDDNVNSATTRTNISILHSTAAAMNLAASNIQPGRILLLQDQYDSAVYPWNDRTRFVLHIVPFPTTTSVSRTQLVLDALQQYNYEYSAVCLPPVHWADGGCIDLDSIGSVCTSHNIPLLIDATQVIGAMEFSIRISQPSMVVASVHKWLRGPSGTCLVYIRPDLHESWEPLEQHGRGREQGDMSTDGYYPSSYYTDGRKFDGSGKANPILLPMLECSMKQVVQQSIPKKLQAHLQSITTPLYDWIHNTANCPYTTICDTHHCYHIIGLQPKNNDGLQQKIVDQLRTEYNIIIALRSGRLRISCYIHTTLQDIQALVHALQQVT